jgi:ABC-type polysaccharide/polyol phosphate export permease
VYCALVPWTFFSQALSQSANSLVDSSYLISKVSFAERWRSLSTRR